MRALVIVFAIALLAVSRAAAAEAPAKARADRVLSRAAYQTEMPDDPAHRRKAATRSIGPGLERLLVALGYVALIVGAAALVFALIRRYGAGSTTAIRPETRAPVPLAPREPPPTATPGPTLADADRLAEAGAFRDAVHTLLLVAIGDTARLAAWSFPPSATGRELMRLVPLEGPRHDGFEALVRAVERAVFGGRDVCTDDYAACRRRCLIVSGGDAA